MLNTNIPELKRSRFFSEVANSPSSQNKYQFLPLGSSFSDIELVERCLEQSISPLYGDQQRSLRLIKAGADRACELLYKNGAPIAGLIYKTALSSNFQHYGVRNSFEIKNAFFVEKLQEQDCRQRIHDRLMVLAHQLFAKSVHVIVPEIDVLALDWYKQKGFQNVHTWEDSAILKVKESLLCLDFQPAEPRRVRESESIPIEPRAKRVREESVVNNDIVAERTISKNISYDPYCFQARLRDDFYQITLKSKYISQIRKQEKTVEGRICAGLMLQLRPTDTVRFFYQGNPFDDVLCRIKKIERFKSFREMLENCGVKRCLPDVSNLEDAVRVYDQIPGYSEKSRVHGVIAIYVDLVLGVTSRESR